jgi:integrase
VGHIEDLWFTRDGSPKPRHGKGNRYRASWADPGGAAKSRTFPDGKLGVARKFLSGVEADVLRGTYIDPRAGKITLEQYVAGEWLPHQQFGASTRELTERRLRLHVFPVLGGKPLSQITASAVKSWLAGLDVAPVTARMLLGMLSSILSAAVDDERIVRNPATHRSVRAPRLERHEITPWSEDRVAAVRAGMPPRYQAMADCGAGLGLRQSEVFGLAVEDVDFLHRTIRVRRAVKRVGGRLVFGGPKGEKARRVALPDSVALELSRHIAEYPPAEVTLPWQVPGGKPVTARLLFSSRQGNVCERNAWNEVCWHPALRAAGITPGREAGFHQLRHHYASLLLARGVDIRTVAAMLGHGDPAFTLRTYSHLMPDAGDRVRAAIDGGPSPADRTATAREAGNPL